MIDGPALVDTNVVVSGLITGSAASPTAEVLDGMIAGRFRFVLSLDLISEYRDVLTRTRIRARHGLSEAQIETILKEVVANAAIVEVEPEPASRWKGDHHLLRVLTASANALLVTGDERLKARLPKGARVLTPREFIDRLDR
jgi:putative PIN family toxin of toxin-antitoxin system